MRASGHAIMIPNHVIIGDDTGCEMFISIVNNPLKGVVSLITQYSDY